MGALLDNRFLCGIQDNDLQILVLAASLITSTAPLCDIVVKQMGADSSYVQKPFGTNPFNMCNPLFQKQTNLSSFVVQFTK